MLLGLSSGAADQDPDLTTVNGAEVDAADAGVDHAAELLAFAEAAWRRDESLPSAREALRAAVGNAGLGDAARTVAIFRSLNIAADASGIPLDDDWAEASRPFIEDLKIDRFSTAANTPGFTRD